MRVCTGLAVAVFPLLALINASAAASNTDQVAVQLSVRKVDEAKHIAQVHGMKFLFTVSVQECDK